jgi:hypothetical protein
VNAISHMSRSCGFAKTTPTKIDETFNGGAVSFAEAVELRCGPPSDDQWRRVVTLIALQFVRRLSGYDDGGRAWDGLDQQIIAAHEARAALIR